MKHLIKKRNFWIVLGGDIFLLLLAYFLSFFIRFEASIPPDEISNFKNTVWLTIPFKLLVFFNSKLYKWMWQYTGINDLINLIKAISLVNCNYFDHSMSPSNMIHQIL